MKIMTIRSFQDACSSVSPKDCALFIGITYFFSAIIGLILKNVINQRFLLLVSLVTMAASQTSVGIYFVHLSHSTNDCLPTLKSDNGTRSPNDPILRHSWTPLPLLLIFTAASNIGVGSLPSLVFTDMLPIESRPWTLTIANVASNISWFLVTKTFRTLQINFGAYSPFFLYGAASLICFVFIFLFLPEPRDQKSRTGENEFPHPHQIRPGVFCENNEL